MPAPVVEPATKPAPVETPKETPQRAPDRDPIFILEPDPNTQEPHRTCPLDLSEWPELTFRFR